MRHMFWATPMLLAIVVAACSTEVGNNPTDGGIGDGGSDGGSNPDSGRTTGYTSVSPPKTTSCGTQLQKPASGVCQVTKPGSSSIVLRGKVITPDTIYDGGEVVIDDKGVIQCAACDCASDPSYGGATVVTCADGVITPALINSHDHITYAQNAPKEHTARYDHRHEWRKGAGASKPKIPASAGNGDAVRLAELRFVLGGVTSTVGSGGTAGMVRNLDKSANLEGLTTKPVQFETFPLGDSDGVQKTSCTYSPTISTSDVDKEDSFVPHIAEGIGDSARNEFVCTSGAPGSQADYMKQQTAMIHAIGLLPEDAALSASKGVGVIWSPRSNIDLYGFTAPVAMFARTGVQMALGTDWTPSGSMNLLRELACADEYNTKYLGGFFADYQLYRMVTEDAAQITATASQIGSIKKGLFGDVTVWNGAGKDPFRAIVGASVSDVALVLRAGKVLTGESAVVDAMPGGGDKCEALTDCLSTHKICAEREFGKGVAAVFDTAAGDKYPVFFCGNPDKEPSCKPYRNGEFSGDITADDSDGDGIPTDCSLTSGDVDGDGVADEKDNCPTIANTNQADADKDGKGDACDACPNDANPGAAVCPGKKVTLSQARSEAQGTNVTIEKVCVTGLRSKAGSNGVWIQDPTFDAATATASGAGFAYFGAASNVGNAGDEVTLSGTLGEFSGQFQFTNPNVTVTGTCPKTIDQLILTVSNPADIATSGMLAAKYNSMLVRVSNVAVTVTNPDDPSDYDEFAVTGNLRVDDYAYDPLDNTYAVGVTFKSITGIVGFSFSNSKIYPRSAADLVQ